MDNKLTVENTQVAMVAMAHILLCSVAQSMHGPINDAREVDFDLTFRDTPEGQIAFQTCRDADSACKDSYAMLVAICGGDEEVAGAAMEVAQLEYARVFDPEYYKLISAPEQETATA